nr:hypothetical protein [uncultured bacterium]
MKFEATICTEDLIDDMGLPEWMKERAKTTPMGKTISLFKDDGVLFYVHAIDHSTYPDIGYTLCIKGNCLSAWHMQPSSDTPRETIKINVCEEVAELSDELLTDYVECAFKCLHSSSTCPPIIVDGRRVAKAPPQPRSPENIMAVANRMADMASDQFKEFAAQALSLAIREDEFTAWLEYGKNTDWRDLSPNARTLVESALKLRNKC